MFKLIILALVTWAMYGIYKDIARKYSFNDLAKHYGLTESMIKAIPEDKLRDVLSPSGCSKFRFRRKIMRQFMDNKELN